VRELQADEKIVVRSARLPVSLTARRHELLQRSGGRVADHELAGVGATLWNNGAGLAPDQLGASCTESLEAAERKLTGGAIEVTITPFHRLDCQPVTDEPAPNANRGPEWRKVFVQAEFEAKPPGIIKQRLA
jgi:hypothetical protein